MMAFWGVTNLAILALLKHHEKQNTWNNSKLKKVPLPPTSPSVLQPQPQLNGGHYQPKHCTLTRDIRQIYVKFAAFLILPHHLSWHSMIPVFTHQKPKVTSSGGWTHLTIGMDH